MTGKGGAQHDALAGHPAGKRQCASRSPPLFVYLWRRYRLPSGFFPFCLPRILSAPFPPCFATRTSRPLSRDLLQRFEHNERMHVDFLGFFPGRDAGYVTGKKRRCLLLCIPRDFSRSINNGGYSTILCIANASNIMPVSAVTADAETIAENFNNEIAVKRSRTGFRGKSGRAYSAACVLSAESSV